MNIHFQKAFLFVLINTLLLNHFNTQASVRESYSNLQFTYINTELGLSQASILCFMQDKQGFIWMGTKDGLNRFDGYSFRTFKHNSADTTSISNNEILSLTPDDDGNIYIATQGGGFNKYIYKTNKFVRYTKLPSHEPTVNCVISNHDGTVWVGTPDGLIYGKPITDQPNQLSFINTSQNDRYLDSSGQITPYNRSITAVESILPIEDNYLLIGTLKGIYLYNIKQQTFQWTSPNNTILGKVNSMSKNIDGDIWASTENGLIRMKWSNQQLTIHTIYNYNNTDWRQAGTDWVNDATNDHEGNIWAGTRGGGLIKIDTKGAVKHYFSDFSKSRRIGDNMINSLLVDRTGVLWIGTESRGAVLLDLNRKRFNHLENLSPSGTNLTNNQVTAITGKGNVIWTGTAFNGLDRIEYLNDNQLLTDHIDQIPIGSNRTSSEIISLLVDKSNQLWIGTQSINVLKYVNGTFTPIQVGGFAFALHQDHNLDIWVGTWGQGITRINPITNQTTTINNLYNGPNTLTSDMVLSIFDDNFGNLWIGTKGGGINLIPLNLINQGYTNFQSIIHNENDSNSIGHNDIHCMMNDSKGFIWIGTGMGLSKLISNKKNPKDQLSRGELNFKTYTEKDGLPSNIIFGIHEDGEGNLWISTINGISKFNPNTGSFTNYNNTDGLQSSEFHSNASYKSDNGNLFFGGVNGLSFFNPEEISTNSHPATPVISRLKVLNQQVFPLIKIAGKSILKTDISLSDQITLTHKHKEFTIEFSALHFANINKVTYAYRLVGFNNEWHTVSGNENSATYTNLSEGHYTFQVKATNNDGFWSDTITELAIEIRPPFWRNPWFYLVYISIILGALMMFRKYSLIAVSEKNRLHIERLERKNLLENTEAKMRFFTNISHEIRSPLTLISNPLNEVIEKGHIDDNSRNNLKLVSKNVNRLLSLTNQLLQLRRIDKGGIEPIYTHVEIRSLLQEINSYFIQKAKQKNILLNFRDETEAKLSIWIDQEMITTSIYNILSNALKFTPSNGKIDIKLSLQSPLEENKKYWKVNDLPQQPEKWIAVSITDTGTGIHEEELEKIFIRFYQTKHQELVETAGSGIGLSIVKEYIDLHQGVVDVTSKLGKGTKITLFLPLGTAHIPANQMNALQVNEPTNEKDSQSFNHDEFEEEELIETTDVQHLPSLLIVDDDIDLANYLAKSLAPNYSVTLASNGTEGLSKALELLPDLIVSDVMMPEMDGTMLCQTLKNKIDTSHIPVILLTAKASDEHTIEGYQSGADLYVTKPFTIDVLRSQIKQLITSRRQLAEKFSKQTMLKPRDLKISSLDERFLDKLYAIIEANLAEPDFDVTEIVKQMNLSHSTVLKKVKALTGNSMVEFVKIQRLKKAAQILAADKLPISDVAYMVGFSDPKYFSKCFSKEFGRTPSEFAANPDRFIQR